VHVAVHDHSRIAYVPVLTDHLGQLCPAFLHWAVAWFRLGITVRHVLSDKHGHGAAADAALPTR
jgi:hypothetical protein